MVYLDFLALFLDPGTLTNAKGNLNVTSGGFKTPSRYQVNR